MAQSASCYIKKRLPNLTCVQQGALISLLLNLWVPLWKITKHTQLPEFSKKTASMFFWLSATRLSNVCCICSWISLRWYSSASGYLLRRVMRLIFVGSTANRNIHTNHCTLFSKAKNKHTSNFTSSVSFSILTLITEQGIRNSHFLSRVFLGLTEQSASINNITPCPFRFI